MRPQVNNVALFPRILLPASPAFIHVLATAASLAIIERSVILQLKNVSNIEVQPINT